MDVVHWSCKDCDHRSAYHGDYCELCIGSIGENMDVDTVDGRLFISGMYAARRPRTWGDLGITGFLQLYGQRRQDGAQMPERPEHTATEYIAMRDADDFDMTGALEGAYQIITGLLSRHERVLVHCAMGVSRSTTVYGYYLMRGHGHTADEAIALVEQARPCTDPRPAFVQAMRDAYEAFIGQQL